MRGTAAKLFPDIAPTYALRASVDSNPP